MASKPSIVQLKQLLRLSQHNVLKPDGTVLVPSSKVFRDISEAMDEEFRFSPKYIYTIVKLNRFDVHKELLERNKIDFVQDVSIGNSTTDSVDGEKIIEFSINVEDIWDEIKPEEVEYIFKSRGKRRLCTLKRHVWTNQIYARIFEKTKIPCALSFKNVKSSASAYFATVTGSCSECLCVFSGRIINVPQDGQPVIMECTIENFDPSVKHVKKRQLKGSARSKVAQQLADGNTLPCVWRRNKADELMDMGDDEPPHLFKSSVLRKAKEERQNQLFGIKTSNIYESLQMIKYSIKYEGAVRALGFDPFFIHYWTSMQMAIYEKFPSTLYIDATRSLVKKLKLPDGELSPHLYLYQAVAQVEEKTVPVFQMISAAQNTNAIAYWLLEFLRIGTVEKSPFPIPKEVVTDFDKALLGAVARAFAQQSSLRQYLCECFELLKQSSNRKPPCLLRLDVCHFMNMLARWKCFSGKPPRVRQLYLRAMAILRKQESLANVEEIARAILLLALSPNQSINSLADCARTLLTMQIRGETIAEVIEDDINNSDESVTDVIEEQEMYGSGPWDWASELYNDCTRLVSDEMESDDVNGFYCPEMAKKLRTLLPYFPLYTEVMRHVFDYGSVNATSAAVESEFNDLKNRVLKNQVLPLRLDKFVCRHILSFSGKLKLALAGTDDRDPIAHMDSEASILREDVLTPEAAEKAASFGHEVLPTVVPTDDNEDLSDLTELTVEQNWRNKNNKPKKHKFSYAEPFPQYQSDSAKYIALPLIPNGNNCRSVRDRQGTIILPRNTCGFDSICQILAMCIRNNNTYAVAVANASSSIFETANILIKEGLCARFYMERAIILLNTQPLNRERRNSIVKVDAASTIANLASYFLENDPSCVDTWTCKKCGKSNSRKHIFVGVNYEVLSDHGINSLAEAIRQGTYEPKSCCGEVPNVKTKYEPHLLMEIEYGDGLLVLKDFPKTIQIADERCVLLAS